MYFFSIKKLPAINKKLHPNLFTHTIGVTTATTIDDNDQPKAAAEELNMDHVYLSYFQLLWAFIFVGPLSYLLWKKAIFMLKLRIFLANVGVSKVAPVDMDALVGKIVLEQSQVIHYVSQTNIEIKKKKTTLGSENNDEETIATFIFPGKEQQISNILSSIILSLLYLNNH